MLLEAHRWNLVSALDIKSMHCTGKKYIIQDNKKEHLYRRKLYRCLIHYALEQPYYTMRNITYAVYNVCIVTVTATFPAFKHYLSTPFWF